MFALHHGRDLLLWSVRSGMNLLMKLPDMVKYNRDPADCKL